MPGGQPGRPAAHDHKVRLDLFRIAIGDEDRLLFHLLEREHEQFLGLRPLGDHHVVCKDLGHAEGRILIGHLRVCLDIDDLERDKFGSFDGRLEAIDRLLRAVRACGDSRKSSCSSAS